MNYLIKYSADTVQHAIDQKVSTLLREGVLTRDTVFIVMMNGGAWFAHQVFNRLEDATNEVYYVKAHSYHGTERGAIEWDYLPSMHLQGRQVIILDDICDSGKTADAIFDYLRGLAEKPKSVSLMTLLSRATTRLTSDLPLYSCITDPTADFFVGCGLDDNGKGRLLPYIGVVKD